MREILLGLTLWAGATAAANAQTQMVERSFKAAPNKDTQIGVYLNVLPDCTSGRRPSEGKPVRKALIRAIWGAK